MDSQVSMRNRARSVFRAIDARAQIVFASSGLLTRLYSSVQPTYVSEFEAVARGRKIYAKSTHGQGGAPLEARLRRNTHRIEKGLCMPTRRPTFGRQYLGQLVDDFAKLVEQDGNSSSIEWADGVLRSYFDWTAGQQIDWVRSARTVWSESRTGCTSAVAGERVEPYRHWERPQPVVSYEDLMALSRRRRSIRDFSHRPVSMDVVLKCIELSLQAPSACNRQPFRFVLATTSDKKEAMLDLCVGATGFGSEPPVVGAIVGDWALYESPRDRHAPYVDASLAAMLFFLALETHGISSCPLNWPELRKRELAARQLLNLRTGERPILFFALGHPHDDALVPSSRKRSVEDQAVVL